MSNREPDGSALPPVRASFPANLPKPVDMVNQTIRVVVSLDEDVKALAEKIDRLQKAFDAQASYVFPRRKYV